VSELVTGAKKTRYQRDRSQLISLRSSECGPLQERGRMRMSWIGLAGRTIAVLAAMALVLIAGLWIGAHF
jgi:hypothetical protein